MEDITCPEKDGYNWKCHEFTMFKEICEVFSGKNFSRGKFITRQFRLKSIESLFLMRPSLQSRVLVVGSQGRRRRREEEDGKNLKVFNEGIEL